MADEIQVIPISPTPTFVEAFCTPATKITLDTGHGSPPFNESQQLCKTLEYTPDREKRSALRSLLKDRTLPDAPRITLDSCQVISYCLEDLDTPNLNKLNDKLWWAGPSPRIKSLSRQLTMDRRIVVTEDPSLHLLWTDNIIYLKPLPAYITSYAFWEYILDPANDSISCEERERLRATALGFLRTYAALIQRRSDYNIACRHDLLSFHSHSSFEAFIQFIMSFDAILDKAISPRWRFGELRLDATNLRSALHLRRWHLHRFESRYGAYFQRFFPVVLFIYALFSVILSAMQVITAGRSVWDNDNAGFQKTLNVFELFSCEAIGWSLSFGLVFAVWWLCIITAEAWKERRTMYKVKKRQAAERKLSP